MAPDDATWGIEDLDMLAGIGFGPTSQLMTEPKLFVDARFLAALQVEFEEELGAEEAAIALFQIGLLHGLRDAMQFGDLDHARPGLPVLVGTAPLAMRFGAITPGPRGLELSGSWPDAHEAEARLSKLGQATRHVCLLSAGYTSGWLSAAFQVDMLAFETTCSAADGELCTFQAREVEAWTDDELTPGLARDLLARVQIKRLRELVQSRDAARASISSHEGASEGTSSPMDPGEPAVHVWGPVMVMPFTDVDTALGTVEMLGRDPAMRSVRVVVVDLGGTILDEGFGAAALEQLIEDVEAWGADVILTGISPLSAEAVEDLASTQLLIRKDVPEAIAYAFQIAEAHQHLL